MKKDKGITPVTVKISDFGKLQEQVDMDSWFKESLMLKAGILK